METRLVIVPLIKTGPAIKVSLELLLETKLGLNTNRIIEPPEADIVIFKEGFKLFSGFVLDDLVS